MKTMTIFSIALQHPEARRAVRACLASIAGAGYMLASASPAPAQGVVPGSGYAIPLGGDNFEDPKWNFRLTLPKSSEEQDHNQRLPGGISANSRWQESAKRGEPDLIRRVPTREGGLPGSTGSMLMRTRFSGVPDQPSGENRQDDLLFNFRRNMAINCRYR